MPTLDFKGKPFVYAHHLSVPFRELVVDADKSLPAKGAAPSLDDNLIIHGDNLEALKALLPRYAGKVDVIYIDPPYNTGNEGWAYNDAVNSPLMKEWLGKVVDKEDMERHDKWLCMMWPRLVLLETLLSETGAIFVSIDDVQLDNLIAIMREIFGGHHVATIPVISNLKGRNDKKNFARCHEYLVVFDRGHFTSKGLPLSQKQLATFKHVDDRGERYTLRDLRKRGGADTREARPNLFYPIFFNESSKMFSLERKSKGDVEILPLKADGTEGCWKWGKAKVERSLSILEPTRARSGDRYGTSYRIYLDPSDDVDPTDVDVDDDIELEGDDWNDDEEEPLERTSKSKSFWWGPEISTDSAKKMLKTLFNTRHDVFDHPKPLPLVLRLLHMASSKDSVILDSFAGSGTTGHATLAMNSIDGGTRRFILVEVEGYADELTAERLRRVVRGVSKQKDEGLRAGLGGSFTFCTLGDPIDLERFFDGESAPPWDQVARYVAYTATGLSLESAPTKPDKDWFVGEVGGYRIHLIYKPDLSFMRSNAAALDSGLAERIAKTANGKPALVYAAAKFMSQKELSAKGITFCQLPYAIHRILGDGPDAT